MAFEIVAVPVEEIEVEENAVSINVSRDYSESTGEIVYYADVSFPDAETPMNFDLGAIDFSPGGGETSKLTDAINAHDEIESAFNDRGLKVSDYTPNFSFPI